MTRNQIKNILGENNVHEVGYGYYLSGRYFLIFEGDVLVKIVQNGSRTMSGAGIVDDAIEASANGVNIGKY